MFKSFIYAVYPILVIAYDRGSHNLRAEKELFRYGDYTFTFYNSHVNWEEARAICRSTNSKLAVLHTTERAKFIAESLSKTVYGFEDVWIGGHYVIDRWVWVPTKEPLPKAAGGYPPWLHYPTKRGRLCLAVDRRNHSTPIFVDLKCFLKRPFVCEETLERKMADTPTMVQVLNASMNQYYLYHARVTWNEAVSYCKETTSHIATIFDLKTALEITTHMRRLRPEIENAWIGARRTSENWEWIALNKVLPNQTDEETGYPPWKLKRVEESQSRNCLLLDQHVCNNPQHLFNNKHICQEPVFLQVDCELQKSFVCEIVANKPTDNGPNDLVTINRMTYIFSQQKLPFGEAVAACNSYHGTLAMPSTSDQLTTIVSSLANFEYSWLHIWIGAVWNSTSKKWFWLNGDEVNSDTSEYLPWCLDIPIHESGQDCLNLDRDDHDVSLIYGYDCLQPQGYVCELSNDDDIFVPNLDMLNCQVTLEKVNFDTADENCKNNKSRLVSAEDLLTAQSVALLIEPGDLMWIGAKRLQGVWHWMNSHNIIPDTTGKDGYPPWGNFSTNEGKMCLAMTSGFRKYPQFIEVPCDRELGYICAPEVKVYETDWRVEYDKDTYYIYKNKVAWKEAMDGCWSQDLSLVTVENEGLANLLSQFHESTHQFWLSAKNVKGSWHWLPSGEPVPLGNNKIALWENENVGDCLILKLIGNKRYFSPTSCDERHIFICTEDISPSTPVQLNYHNEIIAIQQHLTTITKAREKCLKDRMMMVKIQDSKYIQSLMESQNIKSIWVDAHLENGSWIDSNTKEKLVSDIDFPHDNSTNRKQCLMLVLTTNQKLEFHNSNCEDFARFLCTKHNKSIPEKMVQILDDDTELELRTTGKTFNYSKWLCHGSGGELVNRTNLNGAIQFFISQTELSLDGFWINAQFKKNVWQWDDGSIIQFSGQPVSNRRSTTGDCLIYTKNNTYVTTYCNDNYAALCQIVKHRCNPWEATSYLEWTPADCAKKPQYKGTTCRARCGRNDLFGSETVVCDNGNWTSNQTFIRCLIRSQIERELLEMVQFTSKTKDLFIFAVDPGTTIIDYNAILQFSKKLACNTMVKKFDRGAIILYGETTTLRQRPTNLDGLTKTFNTLLIDPRDDLMKSNYFNALDTVLRMTDRRDADPTKWILFLFVTREDEGSTIEKEKALKKLKEMGCMIVVIGLRRRDLKRSHAEGLATALNGKLQLYWFKDYYVMRKIGFRSNCGSDY